MIRFFEDYSLKSHNTFGVDAKSKYFFEFTEPEDLEIFLNSNRTWRNEPLIVLGQGSNILFLNDFDGLIIRPNVPGIKTIYEDKNHEWIEVGAGEIWDELVQYAVSYELGGIENLSLIPGTVGAAPVQNIGAYGQEVCNSVQKIKGYDLEKGIPGEYSVEECRFEYRNSIFKSYLKNRFIITSVIFKLSKFPEFNLSYGQLEKMVREKGEVNMANIRKTIIEIRSSKLPDVKKLGNAGSFFKNPLVDLETAEKIKSEFDDVPFYQGDKGKVKLAAGWLIEKAGWKGVREGNTGIHDKQALVIVNYGNATGKEVFNLSEKIRESVLEKFGVNLEREVNCI